MEKGQFTMLVALLFLALFMAIVGPVGADISELSDEAKACLTCHAQHGRMVTFENNEFVEAYVDAEKFKSSVHHAFSCSQCHPDFSADKHPHRTFRSKLHYQTKSALVCRRCHTDKQIKASSIHITLLNEEKTGTATICTNCHGSHAITHVAKAGKYANEEEYCMKCHGYSVKMAFRNGETLSGTINMSSLQASVHNRLSCSDCHYGFSSEEHPKRNFATRR
ncbi:MAG: hypothetical protein ACM3MD_11005, partial [Betaproteobacteria bacterium]